MFSLIDPGPCAGPCNAAADGSQAQLLDGGNGQVRIALCVLVLDSAYLGA
jgi:hypothetical protein